MNTSEVLELFFSRAYENQLNERVLEDADFEVDSYGVLNYVANVIDIPLADFLQYLKNAPNNLAVTPRHITQSSSFEACECEMIEALMTEGNRGLSFLEIGRCFTKYVKSDNDGAYRKYGENQVKTAEQLGLVFEYYNHWYLNCVGQIYNQLGKDDQQSLLSRNLLRDPLYSRMILDITMDNIDILSYMSCLKSNETKLRRHDSVKRLLDICLAECKKERLYTFSVIDNKKELISLVKLQKNNKKNTASLCLHDYPMVADDASIAQSNKPH